MSLLKEFKSIPHTKILLLEVSKGKRKALIEKLIDHFYKEYGGMSKTHRLMQDVYQNYYTVFDYVYNNWEEVEGIMPVQNLTAYDKLRGTSSSFPRMIKNIGFKEEYNSEQQKIIIHCIIFLTKIFKSFEEVDQTGNMKYGNWLVDVVFPYILKNGYFNNRLSYDDQTNANVVVQEKGTFFEDLPKLQAYLNAYHEMKQKNKLPEEYRDINTLIDNFYDNTDMNVESPFKALNHITKEYRATSEGDFFEVVDKKLEQGKDYEIPVKDADGYIMYLPKTQKANSILGMRTEWCTTYGEHCLNPDYQGRDPYEYEDLIILVNKNDPEEKYQFHFGTSQFMNPDDERIDIVNFLLENQRVLGWILDLQPDQLDDWFVEHNQGDNFIIEIVDEDYYNDIFEKLMSQLGWVQPKSRNKSGTWLLEFDVDAPHVITTSLEWMKNSFPRDIARLSDEQFLNMVLETGTDQVSNINRGVFQERIDLSPNFAKRWIVHYNNIKHYNNLEIYK